MQNRLPTIPEYFKRFVNADIDLDVENSVPCPFHKEEHGKSFTYSPDKKIFRCWGACHTGGNVIMLHKLNYKLATKEEAKKSLYNLYDIEDTPSFVKEEVNVNPEEVARRATYANALRVATSCDDWIELDYIMSMHPVDTKKLEAFINVRRKASAQI